MPLPSYPERVVMRYLKKEGIDFVMHDRTRLVNPITKRPLEIDVLIPHLNTGIEVQSKHHLFYKQKVRDAIKLEQCRIEGIRLLYIHCPITQPKLARLVAELRNSEKAPSSEQERPEDTKEN